MDAPPGSLEKATSRRIDRRGALAVAIALGVIIGLGNTRLDLDFSLRPSLVAQVGLALLAVIVFHEGVHALVARILGAGPRFGFKPPYVFVTFDEPLPRRAFFLVAMAPLVVIDGVAIALFLSDIAPLFANLIFSFNTIGAIGDVWMAFHIACAPRGTWVRDTATGFDLLRPRPPAPETQDML